MKRRTKLGVGATLLIVIAGLGALSVAGRNRDAVAVRIEAVKKQRLVAIVTADGWIRPHRSVDVQADIMGRVTDLRVEEGDRVRAGQILLRIDPSQYEAAVARARAAVSEALARQAQARASLIQAERALERAAALSARDSTLVSRQALEEAETQVRVQRELLQAAVYTVDQARAALSEAQDRLAKTVIRSPIDGIVTRLNVEEGETAIVGTMNNAGSLLLTVSDLSIMEAVVRVDETDVPEIELGDSATIEIDAFPHQEFTGRVTEIGHSAVRPPGSLALGGSGQRQAVDFEVVIQLHNPPAALRPDLSATAETVTAMRDSALVIPIIALTVRDREALEKLPQEEREARAAAAAVDEEEKKDEEGVFVVRKGKAEFVPVKVGIAGREHFEVLEGLAPGDSVVAGPYEAIRGLTNGKPVRRMAETAGPAGATSEKKQ
ncbi:MAG: efflux RND transporter periplasmic adaptor subunit [Gemmatimonadetes bacterium]|nr:efflux RND transporter periplasmic adaptor subunit [Gemmatimonadota bacterium]